MVDPLEMQERVQSFLWQKENIATFSSTVNQVHQMLEGGERELREECYAGWTDDDLRTLLSSVDEL